jgi:predicted enzyme related to lactoylglutathione lyase
MGNVRHFAINADDLPRARRFYGDVFGWRFEAWGPPGFFMIATGEDDGPRGSLQQRRELVPGTRMAGFECTIAVEEDVDRVAAKVKAAGGRVVMDKATIPGVGDLIFFQDPEGNLAGAMRYDPQAE